MHVPHHERIDDPVFRHAVNLLDAGDAAGLRYLLQEHPRLTHQHVDFPEGRYFQHPTLLEFIAENPVRHGSLPGNIVEIAKTIVDRGVKSSSLNAGLWLVATGRVPRECRVQVPLIDLLCDAGADPDSATQAAAVHGEFDAVYALLRRGAKVNLPVAGALGRMDEFRHLLPAASPPERHLALAMACQFGHVHAAKLLLDAGEDLNRYNPAGAHTHATPLHEAALEGYGEVVQMLVERGARLDIKDTVWDGTPADWARHAQRTEIEAYLRAHGADGGIRNDSHHPDAPSSPPV